MTLAEEIAEIATRVSDNHVAYQLCAIAARVRRLEYTMDEMVDEAMASAKAAEDAGNVVNIRRWR